MALCLSLTGVCPCSKPQALLLPAQQALPHLQVSGRAHRELSLEIQVDVTNTQVFAKAGRNLYLPYLPRKFGRRQQKV